MKNDLRELEMDSKNNFNFEKLGQIKGEESNELTFSDEYKAYLDELGAPIINSGAGQLGFDDVYILPDFNDELAKLDKSEKQHIDSFEFEERMLSLNNKIWLISGDKESGKTSLIKYLSKKFLSTGIFPLSFNEKFIKKLSFQKNIETQLEKLISVQYGSVNIEKYIQCLKEKKVAIIDDWDNLSLSKKSEAELIESLLQNFKSIIILVNDSSSSKTSLLSLVKEVDGDVVNFEIKKFGYAKRDELIKKWIEISDDTLFHDKECLFREIKETSEKVNAVIGRSYVPQYPLYVLIVLQSIQMGKSLTEFNNRSNSYFYEVLIKQLLIRVGISTESIATLDNYLSYLSYKIFTSAKKSISYDEWKEFHEKYVENYDLEPKHHEFSEYRKKLIDSRIIRKFGDDDYTFNYKYVLYYFVAKWLTDNISLDITKNEINKLIEDIDIELNSSVLIFVTHLSKNPYVLDKIVKVSNSIFANEPALRLDDDVISLNDLIEVIPSHYIGDTSVTENRKKYNVNRDRIDEKYKHDDYHFNSKKEAIDDSELALLESSQEINNDPESSKTIEEQSIDLREINRAISMTEVMGQILKNYSGTILADQKSALLESAYLVSLRAGNKLFEIIKNEKEEFSQLYYSNDGTGVE